MEYSDEIRLKILKYSLRLEDIASHSLAFVFDINNPSETRSLGNKSSTLSFNQKLNLLLDSSSILKEEKDKIEIMMEVRNQFMHNFQVNSLLEVFENLSGKINKVKKYYPEYFSEGVDIEKALNDSMDKIFFESMQFLVSFKGIRESKISSKASETVYKSLYNSLPSAIDKALNLLINDILTDRFEWQDKEALMENIALLKKQIIIYQFDQRDNN